MENENREDKFEIVVPEGAHDDDKPRKMRLRKKTHCDRCGSCCREGGPALLREDLSLFLSGVLSYDTACAVREGERVRASGDEAPYESFMELVKIRSKEGTAECVFYGGDEEGCAIYENRPLQCREYACWTGGAMLDGLEKRRLTRKDIFRSLPVVLEVIERHEERCSYKILADACEKLAQGDESAAEAVMEMLQYDTYSRPFLEEKFSIPGSALGLILGRPLVDAVREFGLQVKQEGEEYIVLPADENRGKEEG